MAEENEVTTEQLKLLKLTTKYWQDKLNDNKITLVEQQKTRSKKLAPCWGLCKRIVDVDPSVPLPRTYSTVRDFCVCVHCNLVIKYGSSTTTIGNVVLNHDWMQKGFV